MTLASCSTTTTVLPASRNCRSKRTRRAVSRGVQADARFVQHKESIDEARAEAGGQVDPFRFAAGKRARGPVQTQIAQARRLQVFQAGTDFRQRQSGWVGGLASFEPALQANHELQRLAHGQPVEIRQRQSVRTVKQGLRLEARSLAIGQVL